MVGERSVVKEQATANGRSSFIPHRSSFRAAPIPHEHGAWIILYAPLVVGLASAGRFRVGPAALLLLAVTGIFMAREAAGLLLRRRGRDGTAGWLVVYTALAAAGALPLLLAGRTALLLVGVLAAALFGVHSVLLMIPARKRLDRSQWGELLAVGALALTAPAAWAALGRPLDGRAWLTWLACTLYFSSGIFVVKMVLAAVKVKGSFGPADRLRIGRDNLAYHALLAALVVGAAIALGGMPGALSGLAFGPAVVRAITRWRALSNRLPNLKRLGMVEGLYAIWFMGLLIAALNTA